MSDTSGDGALNHLDRKLAISKLRPHHLWRNAYWISRYASQLVIRSLERRRLALLISRSKGNITYAFQPCGRLGNNIQQVLVGFIHCKVLGGRIIACPELKAILSTINFDISKSKYSSGDTVSECECSLITDLSFFSYSEYALFLNRHHERYSHGMDPKRSSLIGKSVINAQMQEAARELRSCQVGDDRSGFSKAVLERIQEAATIVIHLRSGDVSDLQHKTYLPNPLSYYRWLREAYSKCVIVTEIDAPHFLLPNIRDLFLDSLLVSQSAAKDFSVLRHCRNLATSGVGTFPIAAALLNDSLINIYYSDLYLREHLNPEHLRSESLMKHCFFTQDYFSRWMSSSIDERKRLIRTFAPKPQSSPKGRIA